MPASQGPDLPPSPASLGVSPQRAANAADSLTSLALKSALAASGADSGTEIQTQTATKHPAAMKHAAQKTGNSRQHAHLEQTAQLQVRSFYYSHIAQPSHNQLHADSEFGLLTTICNPTLSAHRSLPLKNQHGHIMSSSGTLLVQPVFKPRGQGHGQGFAKYNKFPHQ